MKFKTLMFKQPVNNEEINFAEIYEATIGERIIASEIPTIYLEEMTIKDLKSAYRHRGHFIDLSSVELVDIELTFTKAGSSKIISPKDELLNKFKEKK